MVIPLSGVLVGGPLGIPVGGRCFGVELFHCCLQWLLVYESCYGIGMNLLLEERGKGRGHEACVPCFVLFHATFLEVEGDSLISF